MKNGNKEKDYLIFKQKIFQKTNKRNIKILKRLLIFIFLDLFVLSINIYFLLNKNKNKKVYSNIFKNVDIFWLEKIAYSYQEFISYLNNKYTNNKLLSNNNIEYNKEKKKIVIYFADLYNRDYREKWIKSALEDKFIIEFDSENPDYVFYNIF